MKKISFKSLCNIFALLIAVLSVAFAVISYALVCEEFGINAEVCYLISVAFLCFAIWIAKL